MPSLPNPDDLLEHAAEWAGVGAWALDLTADRLSWTPSMARLLELPADAGAPDLEAWLGHFAPEAQLSLHAALDQARRRGEGFDLELPLLTAGDRLLWVRVAAQVESEAGRPVTLRGLLQDVSARHAAQQEAQRSTELWREAVDATDQAFALFDRQDALVFGTERYRAQMPALAEWVEVGAPYEALLHEVAERGWVPSAIGREAAWVAEQMGLAAGAGGQALWHLADGRVWRLIDRCLRDGTRVRFRQDLTEWMRASAQAQEAASARSRFMAQMSHEIRNPLHAIQGLLMLLGRSELSSHQQEQVQQALGATRSVMELLNDTLDLARIESGKLGLERQAFALEDLWRSLAPLLAAGVGTKPVELVFDLDPQLPAWVLGDSLRLQQVLLNLGSNAVKFTAAGQVVLRVRCVTQDASGYRLAFEVVDTGCGIAPADQARIFLGFQQGDDATARQHGGSGLGLAISQHLVAQMGGQLQVQSEPRVGSRFHFEIRLPRAEGVAAPMPVLQIWGLHLPETTWRALTVQCTAWGGAAHRCTTVSEVVQAPANSLVLLAAHDESTVRIWGQQCPQRAAWVVGSLSQIESLQAQGAWTPGLLALTQPLHPALLRRAVQARGVPPAGPSAPPPVPRLQGLRLLVAEDNATNQQVMTELLRLEGAQVQGAGDGHQVLSAVVPGAFDAVLMDIQMPGLDGMAATRALRAQGSRLPVIGLTAQSRTDERHSALAAGMNECLAKPIDWEHLVRCVARWCGRQLGPEPQSGTEKMHAPLQAAACAAAVDLDAGLARLAGEPRVYARYLRGFLRDVAASAPATEAEWARQLHALQGNAATLGAGTLAQALAALEHMAPADSPADCWGRLQAAVHPHRPALAALATALEAARPLQRLTAAPVQEASKDALRGEWAALLNLLEHHDLAALDHLPRLRARDLGRKLEPLEDLMNAFDFAGAAQWVRARLADLSA